MPFSWNEIKARALAFSREWKGEGSERAEAQSFWNGFFAVFGVDRKRVAVFERQVEVTRAGRHLKSGRIDCFWKGVLLVEHKSEGQDLDRAFSPATDYFEALIDRDLPRYILVSDFARFAGTTSKPTRRSSSGSTSARRATGPIWGRGSHISSRSMRPASRSPHAGLAPARARRRSSTDTGAGVCGSWMSILRCCDACSTSSHGSSR